jgi:hypothetical protein
MKSVSIIAATAVIFASSATASSSDPRECEGEPNCCHFPPSGVGLLYFSFVCSPKSIPSLLLVQKNNNDEMNIQSA